MSRDEAKVILYIFFSFLLIYGGLEVVVLGLGFSVDGVLGLLCESIWGFLGLGFFILTYKNNPGKYNLPHLYSILHNFE